MKLSELFDGVGDIEIRSLMADSPESFRSALVTTLLRFDPNGPEWEILERIYDGIATAKNPGE